MPRSRWRTATLGRAKPAEITKQRTWHTLRHGIGTMARPAPDVVPEPPAFASDTYVTSPSFLYW